MLSTFGGVNDNKSCKTLKFLQFIFHVDCLRVSNSGIPKQHVFAWFPSTIETEFAFHYLKV